jgi:hypothetical protein
MSPLGLYGSLIVILAGSAIAGRAILAASGWRRSSWLEPPIGLAALVTLTGLAIELPGRGITAGLAVGGLIACSALFLWMRSRPARGAYAPTGEARNTGHELRTAASVVALAVLAASIPFVAAGGFGVLGKQVNPDLGGHLYNAEWLRSHEGIQPDQLASGYPVGPHGLAVAVSEVTGAGLPESFTAMLIAVVAITAVASLAVFGELPPGRRVLASLLVGFGYLAASFYVQSAFKETLLGMFALTFALVLREVAGEGRTRRTAKRLTPIETGIPLGLLAAAAVQTYSFPGTAWLAGIAGLWVIARLAVANRRRDRRSALADARWALPTAGVALAVLVLATISVWPRIVDFAGSQERVVAGGEAGTVPFQIAPYEVLGIWLSRDFRFEPPNLFLAGILVAIGLLALILGVVQLARRREMALLAGLASGGAIYLGSRILFGFYSEAKALAIASPLVMLVALCGVLGPAPVQRLRASTPFRRRAADRMDRLRALGASAIQRDAAPLGRAALAVAFVAGALLSTYTVLAGANVDRTDDEEQLALLRPDLEGERVLFLGNDVYAAWELRGALVVGPGQLPRALQIDLPPGRPPLSVRYDFDSFGRPMLDWADFVITTRAPYASEPPSNFRAVRETESFVLWERVGPTPDRRTLREGEQPGAVLDCSTPEGNRLSQRRGEARVFVPPPAYGPGNGWVDPAAPHPAGPPLPAQPTTERPVRQSLRLEPGRWTLSLQYASTEPLTLQAPGFTSELPARLDNLGPFWDAGTIEVASAGPVPFTLGIERPPFPRRLVPDPGPPRSALLGAIVATPSETTRRTVPLRDACGKLVDWYRLR